MTIFFFSLLNCRAFVKALQVRFGATAFNDPMEALISLKISTKVAA